MSKRYGEYEQVNGAVCNDLIDRIEKLEARIEAVKGCVRYGTVIGVGYELEDAPCLLLEHVLRELESGDE